MTHPKNVNIPDPDLADKIREALDLEEGEPIPNLNFKNSQNYTLVDRVVKQES